MIPVEDNAWVRSIIKVKKDQANKIHQEKSGRLVSIMTMDSEGQTEEVGTPGGADLGKADKSNM